MTDYADRWFVDKSGRRRRPAGPVDLMAVNDSNGRDRQRTNREYFHALWDERTGDENCLLFHFLVMFRRLLDLWVGMHGSSKQTGRDENRSARRYQRSHK